MRILLLASVLTTSVVAGDFLAGAAQIVINPAPGTPLAGYYSVREGGEVLDDLHSKALVFEVDGKKAAIVVADLISLPRHVVEKTRTLISKDTGIPEGNVLLAATHTHTAPVIARDGARDDFDGASTDLGRAYTDKLPALLAKSVEDANAALTPARAQAAKGHVENLGFNRRFLMKDGTIAWNPRKQDPNIVRPAGPVDPEVGVLTFDKPGKQPAPFATFVNYAMHPDTTGGVRISADFPGALARALAPVRGGVTVFGNGCCGNINHRNIAWVAGQSGPEESERLGRILAGSVCEAIPRLADVPTDAIRTARQTVLLPLPEITDADRTAAREIVRKGKDAKFLEQVKAFQVFDVLARDGRPWEVEVQVIAIGSDVAFVSLPGEVFVELGLAIKKRSPFAHTYIIELANGSIGYIPNRPAYDEGAYEVISARCAAGSGEQLVETAIKLLTELKP